MSILLRMAEWHPFFSSAVHISWSDVCLCVCVCLHVNQAATNRYRCTQRLVILHTQAY